MPSLACSLSSTWQPCPRSKAARAALSGLTIATTASVASRKAAAARTATAVPSASLARSLSCPPEAAANRRPWPPASKMPTQGAGGPAWGEP
ncbi:Uncharacterised protein [Bordetella pertussis]|nr:Uncharacterised protein [Bordetella pertussis]CFN91602.1 Uncharacterised protein [Bordetella pertussis]CFV83542.1 Uncharacterised protein [Bordetella pertussis]CPI96073.1 Uncharacterised protein [Bordetella pertussis]CPJ55290.1 Uncharacterised protein [Bordetella pertussis]